MKRLLKIVTIFFVSVTFLMPLLECFDRWDRPGLTNDTEFPVFVITLFVTLVLVAIFALPRRLLDRQRALEAIAIRYEVSWTIQRKANELVPVVFVIPPLRI